MPNKEDVKKELDPLTSTRSQRVKNAERGTITDSVEETGRKAASADISVEPLAGQASVEPLESLPPPVIKKDSPAEKKGVNRICSKTFGYGPEFPDDWLEEPQTVEVKVERPKKVPKLRVSSSLIIYEVSGDLSTLIEIGDILCKFNDQKMSSGDEYKKMIENVKKHRGIQPLTLTFTIIRPIKAKQIPTKELSNVFSKLARPQDGILPSHYDYLFVILLVAPRATLGVKIKGYNGKIYVSGIENKGTSISYKCLFVGDAILAIEDSAVSVLQETKDMLCAAFTKKKFVKLIIERPKTIALLRNIKLALMPRKTVETNPQMADDIKEICEKQIEVMSKHPQLNPAQNIYLKKPSRADSHVNIAVESVELPISTDVYNVQLLTPAPVRSTSPATKLKEIYDPLGVKSPKNEA